MIEPERLLEEPPRGRSKGGRTLSARWSLVRLAASNLLAFAGAVLAMVPLLGRRRPVGRAAAGARAARPAERDRAPGT